MKNLRFLHLIVVIALITSCRKNFDLKKPILEQPVSSMLSTLPDAEVSDFEIVAYMPYWARAHYNEYDLQYRNITTLVMLGTISKAGVQDTLKNALIWNDHDRDFKPYWEDETQRKIDYIRFINPNIKILLGLADMAYSPAARLETSTLFNDTNRDSTIRWIMRRYVDKYDFDGVDIDFEDSTLHSSYMGTNYPKFVRNLSFALRDTVARGRKKLCTVTLGHDWWRTELGMDTLKNYIDWLGVQTYCSEKMDTIIANSNRSVKDGFAGWTGSGISANKLVLGLAGFSIGVNSSGVQVSGGEYNYSDLLKFPMIDTAFLPYLTTSLNTYGADTVTALRFSGMYETRRKLEWVKDNGLKGVFLWDISKDPTPNFDSYSLIKLINYTHSNPSAYPKIVGYSSKDYYSSSDDIVGGFHSLSMPSSPYNWVGVYELHTGTSTGYYQYLSTGANGWFTIPSSLTSTLTSNKLYILRFYNGAGGMGTTFYGTSHPFYKL